VILTRAPLVGKVARLQDLDLPRYIIRYRKEKTFLLPTGFALDGVADLSIAQSFEERLHPFQR
jgi:hypothetical protein